MHGERPQGAADDSRHDADLEPRDHGDTLAGVSAADQPAQDEIDRGREREAEARQRGARRLQARSAPTGQCFELARALRRLGGPDGDERDHRQRREQRPHARTIGRVPCSVNGALGVFVFIAGAGPRTP